MEIGKLSNKELEDILFSKIKVNNKEVVIGAGVGKDTSILDFENDLFVISTDPITGSKNGIGKLCVNISCNDIATAMAKPVGMMVTILIPPFATLKDVEGVVEDVLDTCSKNNITLIGGHTEVSSAVNQFILSGVCIGRKEKTEVINPKPGDKIVMSKYAAIEGSAILALDREEALKNELTKEELDFAKELINHTCVIKEGLIAAKNQCSLLHDATEGGILGGLWEIIKNSGYGAIIEKDKIPMYEVSKKIANVFDIDPYKLISSGSMIFITKDDKLLIENLEKENIKATTIGCLIEEKEIYIIEESEKTHLLPPEKDELYKAV